MILIETGEQTEHAFMQAVVFAEQLGAAGFEPVLNGRAVDPDIRASARFHALPYLRDLRDVSVTHLIIIGADGVQTETLNRLRRLGLGPETSVTAFGHFEDPQAEISAATKLSYALGLKPRIVSLDDTPKITAGKSICPCFGAKVPTKPMPFTKNQVNVTVMAPDTEEIEELSGIQFLTTARDINALVYMSGQQKTEWLRSYAPGAHVFGYSEIGPAALSSMSDVLVLTGPVGNNFNLLCLLNNHLVSGSAIIDCTPDGAFAAAGLPVNRGPADPAYLQMYLKDTIIPNLDGILGASKNKAGLSDILIDAFFSDMPKAKTPGTKQPSEQSAVHFMPTNGNGLGHAQRCVLIAQELRNLNVDSHFFAFPSCLPLITHAGFDSTPLVPRSPTHSAIEANDLANHGRLRSAVAPGDVFAFDGGYIFDSVIRSTVEHRLKSVWIRRGLWRADQDNRIPLDREKYFARVIVPLEGLDALNSQLSSGSHIHTVGPIVRQVAASEASKEALHNALAKEFGTDFEKLVVTMLGSGVSHDLSANVQTVCAALERQEDCLNLIVVWPSSVVPAERYAWSRSKVVQTKQASFLAAHADFIVTATGYNSFHEALYNGVPAIFVPQEAPILDDQKLRAETAEKLGLAAMVPASKLSQLDREVRRFANGDQPKQIRAALQAFALPEPGNRRAAELLGEMVD